MNSEEFLILEMHRIGAVKFGQFQLVSAQISPIYVDLRILVSHLKALRMVAKAYTLLLQGLRFDRIAAIPYAALPIGVAVALEINCPLIYPRKEVKGHGAQKGIEGEFEAGETVVVLDDVITTGSSKLAAIESLEAVGLRVNDIVVLIDQEEGGQEELAKNGYQLHNLFTLREMVKILAGYSRITTKQEIEALNYLNQ